MLACAVRTLRENHEIILQTLSVEFALLLKVVLPGAGLARQMTWLPCLILQAAMGGFGIWNTADD